MKIFLSYRFDPSSDCFIHRVAYYLRKQPELTVFCWREDPTVLGVDWRDVVQAELTTSARFVLFAGVEQGTTQREEVEIFAQSLRGKTGLRKDECSIVIRLFDEPALLADRGDIDRLLKVLKESPGECWTNLETYRPRQTDVLALEKHARACAKSIARSMGRDWVDPDGLPVGYPFAYEKDIVKVYAKNGGTLLCDRNSSATVGDPDPDSFGHFIQLGCPLTWPTVKQIDPLLQHAYDNDDELRDPIDSEIVRSEPALPASPRKGRSPNRVALNVVLPEAEGRDAGGHRLAEGLHLPEARPRDLLVQPFNNRDTLTVGVVVSGGIAPGINAVIAGVCERHRVYWEKAQRPNRPYTLRIVLIQGGFQGLAGANEAPPYEFSTANTKDGKQAAGESGSLEDLRRRVEHHRSLAGSFLETSRYKELQGVAGEELRRDALRRIKNKLLKRDIDILYVIGGEGSIRAAQTISHFLETTHVEGERAVAIVAIPKTMDNDILWVWQSFGFLSAVEKAREFLVQLNTEVEANPRLCVVQLFGSDSGFVVSHAALGSGVCQAALIPERPFTMRALSIRIIKAMRERGKGVLLLAETAIPEDVEDYLDNPAYDSIRLDQDEETAVREFIGSVRVNEDDLTLDQDVGEVRRLSTVLACANRPNGAAHALSEALLAINGSSQHYELTKRLIVRLLNRALASPPPANPSDGEEQYDIYDRLSQPTLGRDPIVQDLERLIGRLENVRDHGNTLSQEVKTLLRKALSYPVQSEVQSVAARVDASYRPTSDVMTEKERDVPLQLGRMIRRMKELRNRLVLEQNFKKILKPLRRGGIKRRVSGQTPDALRRAGLKIVARALEKDLAREITGFRVFTNEPRHLIRAIEPSVQDVIFGQRLGTLAVDNAMAGYTRFMISQWLTEFVMVPLELVALGRKRVPEGIFWKSVIANTGQRAELI